MVPESTLYPYFPHGRSLEILRGKGGVQAKVLDEKYEAKLEFPGGKGVQNKTPSTGGVQIFTGTTLLKPDGGDQPSNGHIM